jgi:hypothetical protein
MKGGRQPGQAVDDDRDDGKRRVEQMERHHDAVIERELLGGGEVHLLGDSRGQRPREPRIALDPTARDLHKLFVGRSPKLVGAADAEGRHVIEEEVGPVLGGDDDHDVGARRLEPGAQLRVGVEHRLGLGRRRQRRATRDSGRVAGGDGRDESHRFVPLSIAR